MFRNDLVPTQLESGTKKPFQENEEEMYVRLLVVDNLLWPAQRTGVSAGLG